MTKSIIAGALGAISLSMAATAGFTGFTTERVVLSNGSRTVVGLSKELLRQLPSQASTSSSFTVPVVLPTDAPTGNWTVSIDMPDVYPSTQANAFKIRPANADTSTQAWDASTFRFKTGTVLVVN